MKFLASLALLCFAAVSQVTAEVAVGCTEKSVDIVISLDDSSSIDAGEWKQYIEFAQEFVAASSLAFLEPRYALYTWANWGFEKRLELSSREESDVLDVLDFLLEIDENPERENQPYKNRVATGTPTDAAFNTSKEELDLRGREGIQKIVLFLSDGEPTQSYTIEGCRKKEFNTVDGCRTKDVEDAASAAALTLRTERKDTIVFAIGVGIRSDKVDLIRSFASKPYDLYFKQLEGFNDLASIIDPVVENTCFYPNRLLDNCVDATLPDEERYIDVVGRNLIDMGNAKCQFRFGFTGETSTSQAIPLDEKYQSETGDYDIYRCPIPYTEGNENERAYVEVSRDGESFSSNKLSFTFRDDCGLQITQAPTPAPEVDAGPTIDQGACEVDCVQPSVGCSAKNMDIVLAIDDSGSIFDDQFDLQVQFLSDFVTATDAAFADPAFSVVFFGLTDQEADIPSALDNSVLSAKVTQELMTLEENNIIEVLENHVHTKGWTPIDMAFRLSVGELEKRARPSAGRLVLLVTDGEPTTCPTVFTGSEGRAPPGACLQAAYTQNQPLKDDGVLVMTVGVGLAPDKQQTMKDFASSPPEMFALPDVGDFESLRAALPKLIDAMCFFNTKVAGDCISPFNPEFEIRGKNLIDMGNMKCSFQKRRDKESDPQNPIIETAARYKGPIEGQLGFHIVLCTVPDESMMSDGYYFVEVARDGKDFSQNALRIRYQASDCGADPVFGGGGGAAGGAGGAGGGGSGGGVPGEVESVGGFGLPDEDQQEEEIIREEEEEIVSSSAGLVPTMAVMGAVSAAVLLTNTN